MLSLDGVEIPPHDCEEQSCGWMDFQDGTEVFSHLVHDISYPAKERLVILDSSDERIDPPS